MISNRYRGLALLYLFWATALCSRAAWQYITRSGDILPTHLSFIAGIIYLAIVVWAWTGHQTALRIGLMIEIAGVIVISVGELIWPLSYASAWSHFGAGYLWLPLILPILGLIHLYRQSPTKLDNP